MGLAQEASALPPAFHSHQFLPAQPGGTLLPRSHDKCVRRGVFHNVRELEQSIQNYIAQHNHKPKPYIWTAKARDILEKVKRAWYALKACGGLTKASRALESIERHLSAESEPVDNSA